MKSKLKCQGCCGCNFELSEEDKAYIEGWQERGRLVREIIQEFAEAGNIHHSSLLFERLDELDDQ